MKSVQVGSFRCEKLSEQDKPHGGEADGTVGVSQSPGRILKWFNQCSHCLGVSEVPTILCARCLKEQ